MVTTTAMTFFSNKINVKFPHTESFLRNNEIKNKPKYNHSSVLQIKTCTNEETQYR